MKLDFAAVRKCLKSFDFSTLFREHLGWDKHVLPLDIVIDGDTHSLNAVAQKSGFAAFVCESIPDRNVRLKIDQQVTKSAREHFVIYTDKAAGEQVWHWVRREPGKPRASRDHRFNVAQSGDPLIQRLEKIAVGLEEEESITIVDVAGRTRAAFDVDKVTKKFYDRFKAEHAAFLKFIKGIKVEADLEWYTSLMLNRLMFVYFIQKKGFLDGDTDYLRNRMRRVQELRGKDKFLSFYRYFLLQLFHEGLGKSPEDRELDPELKKLLGKVPYLNGGFFEVHQLEERNPELDISDKAFEKLFNFFDEFRWHLDERPLRADNEINPDVVGYIFEKYINQKQMGAYYTKEDITGYISKNTIIPFLFDAAEKKCPIAFKPDSFLWRLLRDNPDQYIYPAVRKGVIDDAGNVIPLPPAVEAGVKEVAKRTGWNKPASDLYALPTETWREHVARRQRCLEVREKIANGEVHQINDLITLNLDIWQFARDAIVNSEGPELLRAFWRAIAGKIPEKSNEKFEAGISVLDPTCGSGAFLFAALQILESLYGDCLARMREFVEEPADSSKPERFKDFRSILATIDQHANKDYFVLKSIIINNLFGVDIMEEAVEICKLRLFLKLVAQVESANQIEPLPDIDFNIRAGNTLVGYASLDEVKASLFKKHDGRNTIRPLFDTDESAAVNRIEEDALAVEKSFTVFRGQQTKHGGKVTTQHKNELRGRLKKLDAELDRYLAGEYGINVEKQKDFDAWKSSHEPFHWFVEFYGIMRNGGFDVIIGNPPYVEWAKLKRKYSVQGFKTIRCGNLYVLVMERSAGLACKMGRLGLIVPLSLVCTDRMTLARGLLEVGTVWLPCFDIRPASLFEGVAQRLTIVLQDFSRQSSAPFSGGYRRWSEAERPRLLSLTQFVPTSWANRSDPVTKIYQSIERSVLDKIDGNALANLASDQAKPIYIHRICRYFIKGLNFVPYFRDGDGNKGKSEDYKPFGFRPELRDAVLCFVNSSLFYWFWRTHGDGFHCGYGDVYRAPFRLSPTDTAAKHFSHLVASLMEALKANSVKKTIRTKNGEIVYQEFSPKPTKPILDRIDEMLGGELNLSPDEIDFIINYDIKYRLGQEDGEDEE